MRFDFSCDHKLTDEEKTKTENLVNEWIKMDLPVTSKEMSKEEAVNSGAECMFIEKYPDVSCAMFQIWRKEHQTDEDIEFLFDRCGKASKLWWILIEEYAIEKLGAKYYEYLLTF